MLKMQQGAMVLFNQSAGGDCWRIGLSCRGGYDDAVPGQFVMLQAGSGHEALLRRPFSIFGLIAKDGHVNGIELLYRVVGRVTEKMTHLQTGQPVNLIGPLGRGFVVNPMQTRIYLVAGGIGVAPIRFLAYHLKSRGVNPAHCRIFLGGRTQADLLCREDFLQLGMALTLTTDDGSAGDRCLITDPLATALSDCLPHGIFACGPRGMLQCVAGLARQHTVPCQVSMETFMACGIGACLGCALLSSRDNTPYLHVCRDGPVFEVTELAL